MTLQWFRDDAISLALEHEEEGDLREAADIRALAGVSEFIENGGAYDYERSTGSGTRSFRYGIAKLVYAISLYVRAEEPRHAVYAAQLAEPMVDVMEASVETPLWVGVAKEWRGDIFQMAGTGDPRNHYEAASRIYEREIDGILDVGHAFDTSLEGYLDYVRYEGIEPPYGDKAGRLVVRNHERIAFKRDVVERTARGD